MRQSVCRGWRRLSELPESRKSSRRKGARSTSRDELENTIEDVSDGGTRLVVEQRAVVQSLIDPLRRAYESRRSQYSWVSFRYAVVRRPERQFLRGVMRFERTEQQPKKVRD